MRQSDHRRTDLLENKQKLDWSTPNVVIGQTGRTGILFGRADLEILVILKYVFSYGFPFYPYIFVVHTLFLFILYFLSILSSLFIFPLDFETYCVIFKFKSTLYCVFLARTLYSCLRYFLLHKYI